MQFWLWTVLSALLRRVPLPFAYAFADAVGWGTYIVGTGARHNMERNYRRVLPHASRRVQREVARRSLQNYCRYLVDFARLGGMDRGEAAAMAQDNEAFARLREALADGRGVVIVCMHFGNWDLGGTATAAHGFPFAAIGERFGDPRLDREVFGEREALGMRILPLDGPMIAAVRHLRAGGALALLVDRPLVDEGIEVEFFGAKTHVPAGPARLARRTGSALVAAAMPRVERNRPEVTIEATFGLEQDGEGGASEEAMMAAVMRAHERYIRRWPDQWYMFRDMWPGRALP